MMQTLTLRIAQFIRKNNPQSSSLEVLQYGISIFLNTALVVVFVCIVSILTDTLPRALAVFGAFICLRYVSGGLHLRSSTSCNIVSVAVLLFIIHLPDFPQYVTIALTCWALVLVALHAPRSRAKNNYAGEKYRLLLKYIGVAIVCSNFAWMSPVVAASFWIQSVMMTNTVYYLTGRFDPEQRFFTR
jgi:accessory gene regulator B